MDSSTAFTIIGVLIILLFLAIEFAEMYIISKKIDMRREKKRNEKVEKVVSSDISCPACNLTYIEPLSYGKNGALYYCKDCGHKFLRGSNE